jgi:hypothetical protein
MSRSLAACVHSLVLVILLATPLSAQQVADPGVMIPLNMHVNPVLVQIVTALLASSPAFAAQCAQIADARFVRITINPVMSSSTTSRGSARTAMRRFTAGALVAVVDMPVPLTMGEYAELFGHELEHVIEQIDGVDLQAMTDAHEGASRLADGAYETVRARRAGLLIAEQIERPRPGRPRATGDPATSRCGMEGTGIGTAIPGTTSAPMPEAPAPPRVTTATPSGTAAIRER